MLTAISRFLFIATLVLFGHSNALLSNQPNIIVIFTDDQGYSDLGIQGIHEDVQTPHIDDLVESGIRMTCGFVTAPQCMPSRVGILTGRYQQFSGVESNVLWTEQNSTNAMLPKTSTIASKLKEQGYVTGMSGKWGVGGTFSRRLPKQSLMITNQMLDRLPHARGFDEYFCGTLDPYVASHDVKGEPLLNPPEIQRDPRYRVNVQADAAVSFIDRHAHGEQPFFLYFAPYSPHSPFDAPKDYLDRFSHIKNERRRTCLAMMSCVDDSVGRLIGKLKEHDIRSNTLVWYISDNGAPKNGGGSNEPWSGWKGNLTDGGIRVPFAVSWPAKLKAGQTYTPMVSTLDILPTCLAAASNAQETVQSDGVNLLPFFEGSSIGPPHASLFFRWTFNANTFAAVRTDRWKLLKNGNQAKLFDLKEDPAESQSVASAHQSVTEELKKTLEAWQGKLPKVINRSKKRVRKRN